MHYISYLLTFQTILAGPNAFFEDYMAYLDGSNFPQKLPKEVNYNQKYLCMKTSNNLFIHISCI